MPFRRIPILLALVFLATSIPATAEFYTDWLWYQEVGYQQVFVRTLSARGTIGLVTGGIVLLFLWLNLRLALRSLRRREFTISTPDGPRVISVDSGRIRSVMFAGALIASVLMGLFSASNWETWLYYLHAVPFGRPDPILGRDISFYLFQLPLLELIEGLALMTVVLGFAGVVAAHFAAGNIAFDPISGVFTSRAARQQLAFLAAALLLVLAFGAWLRVPQQLTSVSGVVAGASYADVHARMPAARLLLVVAVIGAMLAAYQSIARRLWPIALAVGLYVVTAVGGNIYAAIIQRFVVAPNEQVRETPYITNNIKGTREAFALDQVEERSMSGEARLTRDDLDRNAATIENVPLWNDQPLLDTFSQIQEIRTYYDFVSVDNDRYTINGKYRQIMLSARELNSGEPSEPHLDQRAPDIHARLRPDARARERSHARGTARAVHSRPSTGFDRRPQGHPAGDLLRRAAQQSRVRQDEDRGIRLPPRRRQRVHDLSGQRWRADVESASPPDVRDPVPIDGHVFLADADARHARDDAPAHPRARPDDRAVPQLRPGSLPGNLRWPSRVGPGLLHDEQPLSLFDVDRRT